MIDTNMYDTDDVVTTVRTAVAGTKLPVVKGYVTEIELNGKKVELINAEYIMVGVIIVIFVILILSGPALWNGGM